MVLTRQLEDGGNNPRLRSHQDCRTLTELVHDSLPPERALGPAHRVAKGEFLWTSNTLRHDVYFVKRGQVAILLSDSVGCEVIVRIVQSGELFGELCFCSLRNEPRKNCAQAVVDSEVLRMDLPEFLTYLKQDPDALEAFTFTFCKRLADAESRIEVLSHRGAEARLGRLLLQLAESLGLESARRRGERKLAINHDELARMAAMTRPHVSVTMSKLRSRDLIHYERGSQLTVHVTRLAEYLDQRKGNSEE